MRNEDVRATKPANMANHPIGMIIIKSILKHRLQGLSNRRISQVCNVSRDTVNLYVQRAEACSETLEELLYMDEEKLASLMLSPPGAQREDVRLKGLLDRMPGILRELSRPHVTRMVVWEEYRRDCPEGYGYTQFCEHLSRHLRENEAVMHLEHKPGEELQFDLAGDALSYYDSETGEARECPVFVGVLPFSGYTWVEAMPTQRREHVLAAMSRMVRHFGGITQSVKSDNMRQYVVRADRYEPSIAELVMQWGYHYGTTLMATRVNSPRDKAAVESAVNSVYRRIYAFLRDRKPRSLSELNADIREALDRFNDTRMQKRDFSRRQAFERFERPYLRPLPDADFVPKTTARARVSRDYHVQVGQDRHHYSVPFTFLGRDVSIIYDTDHVEVWWQSQRIALHRRSYVKNGYTTLEAHMPPSHLGYRESRGWTAEEFLQRAGAIGPHAAETIGKVLERRVFHEQAFKSCVGILRLADKYGRERLEAACRRAASSARPGYTLIKNILDRGLDRKQDLPEPLAVPSHENIRGTEAFAAP